MKSTPASSRLIERYNHVFTDVPSMRAAERLKRDALSAVLTWPIDRVNVLGDDNGYGHTGCVNALSWARDGELLLSGGDDRTVRVWRMDPTNDDADQPFPYTCRSVIHTGHRANIFNNKMLPHSSRIHGPETIYTTGEACTHVIRCHRGAVKRIITEHSPDLFLTVSEDGTVRQHDLRVNHRCRRKDGGCPTPIVKVNFELMSMSLSPLTPHQLIVAGESPYGYLFDRRHSGRFLQEEWGVPPSSASEECLTTCVRRFGRPREGRPANDGRIVGLGNHITGCKIGLIIAAAFSADAIYLYSTLDDPADASASRKSPVLPSNTSRSTSTSSRAAAPHTERPAHLPTDEDMERDIHEISQEDEAAADGERERGVNEGSTDSDSDDDQEGDEMDEEDFLPNIPTVMPRRRFVGARNVRTVKDVNYLGPSDEFVVSGSDDGNLFIWRQNDGKLVDILEGDGEVVNVIEGHPRLPLFAVSGIDTTVKLFAPRPRSTMVGTPVYSRMGDADDILEANSHQSPLRGLDRTMLLSLAAHARMALASESSPTLECTNQ
ncbi:WD40-repeat-containing domain protein [Schizophyllum fasciatum]